MQRADKRRKSDCCKLKGLIPYPPIDHYCLGSVASFILVPERAKCTQGKSQIMQRGGVFVNINSGYK